MNSAESDTYHGNLRPGVCLAKQKEKSGQKSPWFVFTCILHASLLSPLIAWMFEKVGTTAYLLMCFGE